MNLHGLSDSVAGVTEAPTKCRQCSATTRLGNGLCLSCTLREGLQEDREASRESFEAILAEDEVPDTHWRVGNYEILEEIGRGGMGVIYRARQRHSRRIVALKRIVSYHADSRDTLERFRREAEAAASLDHPNILPIYEVGQAEDGLPFFSMKYAAGGSLQKAEPVLRAEPRECVRLTAKVARAVQYAHEHGVLHRDLKPGNILLDGHGEPFVTDFGLAKWLDTRTDLTRTLTIFGTPGYIAPEQAKAPAAKLTPAADIYSLGAILFDLFTGRPPFLGEHALAVIQQASEKPAPKLRSLAPKLDRDLETICARCLEREPQARYRSAGDLAADLERWLEGRPIVARRVSPPMRAWRWSKRNPKLAAATAAAFCSATAAAFLFFSRNGLVPQSGPLPPEKSIAVLPFENLSGDPNNAYFAEGIQDEILTRLSKIADLKVISRTSTQHYKTRPENLSEIGRQLGVTNILEGSVQKSGDAVRVNVQLIKADTDSHLWADTFDRKLTDIFSVESDVAKAIADQLGAKLTGREEQIISSKPTDNPDAYDAYLRGLAYSLKTANSTANVVNAQKYLREAVRLDPKFALSWALLSFVESRGYGTVTLQPTDALREEARQAAETALSLQPNLGEAILAKGFYHYACLKDYDTAVRCFEQARQFLPNSSRIPESLAYVTRRQGKWDRSEMYFNEAERLDPRNVSLLTQHALSYKDCRRFPEALRKLEQILNITPDDVDTIVEKAAIAQAEGDLPRASALLASVQPAADDTNALETQAYQAILERRPAPIISQLKVVLANPDAGLGFYKGGLRFWLGWTQDVIGDHVAAKESWQQARRELEPFLTQQPENHILLGDLAMTAMSLGDKAAALDFSERAMAALPVEKDAVRGPATIEFLARVAANIGESDRAIAALERLLSIPYSGALGPGAPLTPALLRLDPMFDPLRNDPRFEKMVKEAKEPDAKTVPAKSIAVLPFENLSRDPDNAYFAEGVQDEILARLSKIADLKVISRTSTQHYKSSPGNLPEIAKQLGVAHILEGSVQKSGDAVRVNVQLIKAANDSHVWADTFDRKLTDTFSVESEVAKAIADQLGAKLTGQEEQVIAAKPTENPEAYDAYLRGLAYSLKTTTSPANALAAQKYLREAVRLDPKFALGWALLSHVDARGYIVQSLQPTVALREEARQAAETALALQPNLGEAVLAKGYYHYACLKDYETAVRYFEQARPLLPNSSRIPESLAYLTRRQGQWDRSESYFNEAERLDPRNVTMLNEHAASYISLRRFPEAVRKLDQVLDITPDDVDTLAIKAAVAQAEGDLPQAAALLASLHPNADNSYTLETQVYQEILERRPAQFTSRLKGILTKPDPALGYLNSELRFWLGWAQEVAGDHAAAQASRSQARSELESFLKEQPDNYLLIGYLALCNITLGDKAAALALSERAMAALPIEKDALTGPIPMEILARVAAQMGEPDRAIATLQKLLSIPYAGAFPAGPLTPALLRLDPMFDPLRNDSRFQKLVEEGKEARDLAATNVPAKSIAVLPFENLSRDPDNAYFAEGVQDEILTRLSKIADLKVISRTSTRQYKSAPANVPDIAKQLGVAFIVEGSVQKSGDAVRVNVQLIKAASDSHVWADTFDRKLTDAFSVESEVAKAIADQLGAKLTGKEEQVMAGKPTDNPEAYDAYLRGLAYSLKPANTTANSLGAQKYLREAVRLDPKFARAWALLSSVDSLGYLTKTLQPTVALREEARQAAETALSLEPHLGEALLAKGNYHYGCLKDYDNAIRYFEQARQILPNDSRIPESLAYVTRRRGQWERSETYFNEAERLDPRNANLLTQHAVSLMRLRRLPEALRKLDEVLNITPDDVRTVAFKAGIAQAEGDLPRAAALLAPLHPNADDAGTLETQAYQAILERSPAAIIPRLEEILAKPDPELGYFNSDLRYWLGWAQNLAGDHVAAQKSWRLARSELELFLKDQPENFNVLTDLALTNMGLGDKPAALAFAERAIAANPIEKDAISGPSGIETLARVAAQMGEPDRAIAALQKLLSIPAVTDTAAPFTAALLRLDPMFDPLRSDSRFQELVAPAGIPKDFGTPAQVPPKSIAVLPFENRSSDTENAFFTDGVQDEILTDLAKIAALKVISRTSVMQYKSGTKRNLRQIGNELGVAHVLEGSVQRAGNRVRVNAQLIDARTDAHLWAQTYDRDLADVFAIQSEIAKTIADQLQAKLSPNEKSAIDQTPTGDVTAFDLYSRAKILSEVVLLSDTEENLRQAIELLNQAVARDPSFFNAYCQLGYAHDAIYFSGSDHTPARLALAEAAIQTAFRLRPTAGESHLARAWNLYWGYLDYDGALAELKIARQSLPNDPKIFLLTALIQRRQGRWDESIQNFERAMDRDPRNVVVLQQAWLGYGLLRRYREEEALLDRALAVVPGDVVSKVQRGVVELNWHADTRPLHDLIEETKARNPAALSKLADAWLVCALGERDAVAVEDALKVHGENRPQIGTNNISLTRLFLEGVVARMSKDEDKARSAFTAARAEQEKTVQAQPNHGPALCVLGLIDAGLGRKEEALREGRRAMELLPPEKDSVNGPAMIGYFAMIAAWVGDKDLACEQLAAAIRYPSSLSYGQLKLFSFWDPLRGDPRFEQLVEEVKLPVALSASESGARSAAKFAPAPEKSIAVLPFENRSRDPDNAFFTDGVQDEILTDLARIADLKVISRTSVMQYKSGTKRNLRQIGNELGVAHVLEGSVQRAGKRVRVNAQLIDARTDAHLWAQTYDRELADVFAIQSEIAKTIADQLQTKLSPSEKSAIEQPPTTDITAFDYYAHAKNLFLTGFAGSRGKADLQQAADLLNQAVARDPAFFEAYCQLAFTEISIYFFLDHTAARLAAAEAAVQTAARLRSDAGETHLARARNLYWGYLDYDGALRELEIARKSLPGEDWIFSLKGYIERRQGRWEESIHDLERASELDPRNVLTLQQLGLTYEQLRRYAEQKSTYERILVFEPNDPVTRSLHAFVELDSKADTRPLHEVIDSIRDKNTAAVSSIADNWLLCALAQRDPAAASKALIALGENQAALGPMIDLVFTRPFMEGLIARLAKDDAKAQAAFTAARTEQEKIIQAQPNHAPALCVLGLIDAALGRKEEALREGRRAVELSPMEKDANRGIAMVKYLAMIAAWVGDKDLACEQLAIAVRNPSDLSYGQLKLMPFWDPLRGDRRFEKLVEEAKQPVALSTSTWAVPGQASATTTPEKSVAVLPFENLSRDPDNAFFTDGVHEEILTDLARIADLKVISRTSVMQYNSRVKPNLRQIANELGVAHVVEGSVQRAGNRVRVNAQLIDARSDAHLWAQTYDRELTDIFAVESDIASTIADTLQAKLTGSERTAIASKPTENPEAYQLYLRGRFFWNKRTASDLRKALNLFEKAVAKDPHYAQAYAAIAQSWLLLPAYEDSAPKDCFPNAQTAAEKALGLDQSLSDAHTALAAVKVLYNFDPLGSIAEFEQAIKLNPNDATAHHWLGNHPLTGIGDLDRALTEVRRAQELDPLSLVINTNVGWGLLMKGRYDEAVAQLQKTIEMDGTFYYARYILGQALQLSGHIAEAEKEYKKASELATDPVPLAYLDYLYGTNGRKEEARKILSQLLEMRKQSYVDAYCLAIAYLGLEDRAEAMNWLEQGYRDRNGYELGSLRVDPFLAPLRSDPRFEALAEKIVPAREFKRRVASK